MARPYKSGLEYFAFDIDFFEDEKITAIFVEFGIKGEIIAIRLLCAIYRNSYYARWDVPLKMKIAKSSGLSPDLIDLVVERLVKWDFFDQNLFNSSNILTSKGIQKRYLESTKRRLDNAINDYCLLNDNNNQVNVINNLKNDDSNPQSRVKESKVERKREGESSDIVVSKASNQDSMTPALIDLSKFESEYPKIDHQIEFRRCQDYYIGRRAKINDWNPLYRNWLAKDYPKALKPAPKRPPEKRIALPSSFHELTGESGRPCSECGFVATPISENGTGQIAGFFCQACGNYDLVELPEVIESQ